MGKCAFREAYGGDCGAPTQLMDRFCIDHLGQPCDVCNGQSHQECGSRDDTGHPCCFPICMAPACITEHTKKWHPK